MTLTSEDIESQADLADLLQKNPGKVVMKLGAEWCGPCKTIEKEVHEFFENAPANIQTVNLDVDESFDIYATLKRKKIVTAIPAMLCFKNNNKTLVPDEVLIGANKEELAIFFNKCLSN